MAEGVEDAGQEAALERDALMLLVRHGEVLSAGAAWRADVLVDGGSIVDVAPGIDVPGADVIDASGCYVTPGFIDLQLNGAFGIDFTTSPAEVTAVGARLTPFAVTSFCPTVISCPAPLRDAAIAALGPRAPIGIHLEGPLLNPVRRGAHPLSALAGPAAVDTSRWTRDHGVALVTLAPEVPGALDLVVQLVTDGVVVSAGHTDATAGEFTAAVDAGVRYVTHLFNGMRPFAHRDPGVIGAALTDERVVCGLIADGIHVDPTAVRVAWRALGPQRCNLVSDAVAVLGMPDRRARVGNVELVATPEGVREPGGALAGSDLTLDRALRNLVAWTGCAPADAICTVTSVPARVLGLRTKGEVSAGFDADLVVLDRDLRVKRVIAGGVAMGQSV